MGYCQGRVLSDGGFVRVEFCLMGFCQDRVLSDGVLPGLGFV